MTDICRAALMFVVDGENPDLTMRQIALLGLVCAYPGSSTGSLATWMAVSKPVVTRATNTLEAIGLIERRAALGDRRKVEIRSTHDGRALRERLRELRA